MSGPGVVYPPLPTNQLSSLAVGNTAANGPIGGLSAPATVDAYGSFVLTQTTSGVTATLPTPTSGTAGKTAVVSSSSASTTPIVMYGAVLTPGGTGAEFQWDGTEWTVVGNGAQSNVFTYQQGGAAVANVYTSFAAAWAAMLLAAPLAPTFVVDGTFGSPVMPAGNYALPPRLTITGLGFANLTIQDGAHFTSGAGVYFIDMIGLAFTPSATTSPCWALTAGVVDLTLEDSEFFAAGGMTQPWLSVASTVTSFVYSQRGENSFLQGTAAAPIITFGAGLATGSGIMSAGATTGNNAFGGAGAFPLTLADGSVSVGATQPATGLVITQKSQPANTYVALSLSAAGGAQGLPARPSQQTAPVPSFFLGTPSGNQASTTTYTLPVGGAYQPGDIVRVLYTNAQLAGANVIVKDGGAGTPTLGTILLATASSGHIDAQLNAAGTHWTLLAQGGG